MLKKAIDTRVDPEQVAAVRAAPLTGEQTVQQQEIRAELLRVQTSLAHAEEEVTVLRAKLASVRDARARPAPRMDAVIRTITKLTTMAEKKSGDVDILESQLRKLTMAEEDDKEDSTGDVTGGLSLCATPSGRHSNGFRTPKSGNGSGTYGLYYTPDNSPPGPVGHNRSHRSPKAAAGGSLGASMFSNASSIRQTNGNTPNKLNRKQDRDAKKRQIAGKMSSVLEKIGPREPPAAALGLR